MNDALAWGYGFTITRLDPAEVLDLPKAPESEWRAVLTGLVDAMNRYGREVGDGDIPSAHRDLLWRAEQLLGSGSQLADANQKQINEAEHG